MARISEALHRQVAERARGLCEYCQTAQVIVVTMEVDHIVPRAAGGSTQLDNLCYTCRSCNSFKQNFQFGVDPDTRIEVPLFNPRTQDWYEHFAWAEDGAALLGLTPVGRATIHRLRMNRETILASRRKWVQVGWHPPKI